MDKLLSKNISVEKWCEDIIKEQEKQMYTSTTNPRDLNGIVKKAVQDILDYLKSQGKTSMKEVNNLLLKEALNILVPYLRKHEVWKPLKSKPLNDEELEFAFKDLYNDKYVRGDRMFRDPEIKGQQYALFSFTPSSKAQPDDTGIYGFIKVRGTFCRLEEAEEKSKELIRYFSANQIFVCETGSPVPLQNNAIDQIEVDNPNRPEDAIRFQDLAREQNLKEKQAIEEIRQREEQLRKDVEKDPNNKEPLQIYLELIHKRATCAYLYTQHLKKLEETKNIIMVTRKRIADMDNKYPNLKDEYIHHYMETCKNNGIDKATDEMALYIKKFIGEDPDLGF